MTDEDNFAQKFHILRQQMDLLTGIIWLTLPSIPILLLKDHPSITLPGWLTTVAWVLLGLALLLLLWFGRLQLEYNRMED